MGNQCAIRIFGSCQAQWKSTLHLDRVISNSVHVLLVLVLTQFYKQSQQHCYENINCDQMRVACKSSIKTENSQIGRILQKRITIEIITFRVAWARQTDAKNTDTSPVAIPSSNDSDRLETKGKILHPCDHHLTHVAGRGLLHVLGGRTNQSTDVYYTNPRFYKWRSKD